MLRSFSCPSKYVQGPGELSHLGEQASHLGHSFFIVGSEARLKALRETIDKSLEPVEAQGFCVPFRGECTKKEVARLRLLLKEHPCDAVIGIGGGKALDTARAVACYESLPVVIVPTVASCDAPTSSLVIFYTDDGLFEEKWTTRKNPDLVLVDSQIIAEAPTRLLVAGMGDALATFFEARTCVETYRKNYSGGQATLAAYSIAKLCYETLLAEGLFAKRAAQQHVVTRALENVIEANILLSGIGFECNGSAAAHSVCNGFSAAPCFHDYFHGEWVAFGTLVLLFLENRPRREIEEVLRFCVEVGLPITLKDLGMEGSSKEALFKVAEKATAPNETIHKEPFPVGTVDVLAAILVADAAGKEFTKSSTLH